MRWSLTKFNQSISLSQFMYATYYFGIDSLQDKKVLQGFIQTLLAALDAFSPSTLAPRVSSPQLALSYKGTDLPFALSAKFQEIALVLVNDCRDVPPLIQVRLMNVSCKGFFGSLIKVESGLVGYFFNFKTVMWEPFLEATNFFLEYSVQGKSAAVSIVNHDLMNLNATPELIACCQMWWKELSPSTGKPAYYSLQIRNLTAGVIRIKFSDEEARSQLRLLISTG
jgi:hypothetical protein